MKGIVINMKKGFFSESIAASLIVAHLAQILYIPVTQAQVEYQDPKTAISQASASYLSQSMQQWLNQYGTAEVKTGYSFERDTFDVTSIDMLLPLYDKDHHTIFTQLGYRYEDSVDTLNFGVGYRVEFRDSLVGSNIFYDRDMSGDHDRIGIGAEYFRDYIRFTGNGYVRLSDWKEVDSHFDDYPRGTQLQARAANGFDISVDAYHPEYAKLGFNVRYEHYFGDEVDLFKGSQLQSDPYGITLGLNYTPIPLMTWHIEHTEGKQGVSDTKGKLALTYRFGVPLEAQIDPDKVKQLRSFQAGKFDLVKRNPIVTLQYRAKPTDTNQGVDLPNLVQSIDLEVLKDGALANGIATNQIRVMLKDDKGMPLSEVAVRLSNDTEESIGVASSNGDGYAYFDIPSTVAGVMPVLAQVIGNEAMKATAQLTFIDEAIVEQASLSLLVVKEEAVANGFDEVVLLAKLTDKDGKQIEGIWLDLLDIQSHRITSSQTNSEGSAEFKFSSQDPGLIEVYAKVSGSLPSLRSENEIVRFKSNPMTAAVLYMNVLENNAIANGVADNVVEAIVLDENNQLMPFVAVSFYDESDINNELKQVDTDEDGRAQFRITSLVSGPKTLRAVVTQNKAVYAADSVIFRAVPKEIRLSVTPDPVLANGVDTHELIATVLDFNQSPIEDINVDFVDDEGAILQSENGEKLIGLTDEVGQVKIHLASTEVKTVQLMAIVDESNIRSSLEVIEFIADMSLAIVASVTPLQPTLKADGADKTEVKVVVTDIFANRLADLTDIMVTDNRGTVYSGNPFRTDDVGEFMVAIEPSYLVGDLELVVTLPNGATGKTTVEFIQDYSNATLTLTADTPALLSNGIETTPIRGTLLNQYGYPIANEPITLSDSRGWESATTQTDENGEFVALDFPSSLLSLVVDVSAVMNRDNSIQAFTQVTFNGDINTAEIVLVESNKPEMIANSDDVALISAKVVDQDNNPVSGQSVTFIGENNELIGDAISNASGYAVVQFFSSSGDFKVLRPLGPYEIEASMTNEAGIHSTGRTVVNLISSKIDIRIDRLATLQAPIIGRPTWFDYRVTDRFGNPVFIDVTLQYRVIKGHEATSPEAVEGVDYELVNHIPINEHGIGDLILTFNQAGPYRVNIIPPEGTTGILDVIVLEQ